MTVAVRAAIDTVTLTVAADRVGVANRADRPTGVFIAPAERVGVTERVLTRT